MQSLHDQTRKNDTNSDRGNVPTGIDKTMRREGNERGSTATQKESHVNVGGSQGGPSVPKRYGEQREKTQQTHKTCLGSNL
jgi:hypothetical protein